MAATRRSTDSISAAAVKELTKAVKAVTELGEKLDYAIFGRWDKDENRKVPGLEDRINAINTRLDTRDRRDKFAYAGMGVLLLLGAASAAGVPTHTIAPALAQAWQAIVAHSIPPP